MHISFKNIKLHNFLSFFDCDVNLDKSSYTLISGVNNCSQDNAKSNGVGKSAIWDALVWCLTGETVRGTKDIISKSADDGAFVELSFSLNGNDYKVTRYKEYSNIGTNLKIFVNGEDKSGKGIRDGEKLLEEYIPDLTSSFLGSVIILGQGLPQRFTNNTPSGRKEVLEKLSKSDYLIQDIKDRLSERKDILSGTIYDKEKIILADNSKLSVYESQLANLEREKEQLIPENFASIIVDLELKIKEYNDKKIQLETDKTKEEIKYNINRAESNNIDRELENKKHSLIQKFNINLQPLINKETELNIERRNLTQEINRLESIKDVCPTCGQKLPDVHKVDTSDLKIQLSKIEIDLSELKKQQENQKANDDKEYDAVIAQYDTKVIDNETEYRDLVRVLNKLNNDLRDISKQIEESKLALEKTKLRRDNYENKINTIDKDIAEVKTQITLLKDKVLYNNIEKDKLRDRCDIVTKMLTIATRDFRGFLLSGVIDFINQKAKEYCAEVFETQDIEFKLDGNNVFIGYCGKQYENLSGGEKQKVDLIVQFSIRDMLSQFLNFSCNILVLDEIFDNLDQLGCQKVLELISNKLTDVQSIFVITHHQDIQIPCDNEILIVKNEYGISEIH